MGVGVKLEARAGHRHRGTISRPEPEAYMTVIIGWDLGGAHLKAARAEHGVIVDAVQVPSPLRLGLAALSEAFTAAKARIGSGQCHAVTMTAELADTFTSRPEGVRQLIATAVDQLA